jgi:hypothetical protein
MFANLSTDVGVFVAAGGRLVAIRQYDAGAHVVRDAAPSFAAVVGPDGPHAPFSNRWSA